MMTKLTLTIEEEVIKTAKKYAQNKGRSLSGLVESYLKALASEENKATELSPRIKRLRGAIKLPPNFHIKKILEESISNKYKQS